jgi:hypothetical protein
MSFVITMYVREGIVMASDSRLSLNITKQEGDKQLVHVSVGLSDSNYTTFLAPNNVGISTYGTADIKGVPIAGYIESFISEIIPDVNTDIDEVPPKLLSYFRKFDPHPDTKFIVAGYKSQGNEKQQQVWLVDISNKSVAQVNPPGQQGAQWGGEADILTRLILPVAEINQQNKIKQVLPFFPIPWQFFTLQDAIDFCIFAVRSTTDAIRFLPRAKTVGGPIDVLVIKPDNAFWVQRKELHG